MAATICLDFDGVVHSYTSGWQGDAIISDPPVPGTKRAIEMLRMDYEVKIYSTRCRSLAGRTAVERWLEVYGIVVDEVCEHKPPAIVYVDDRGIQFKGDWMKCIKKIHNFHHWIRKGE